MGVCRFISSLDGGLVLGPDVRYTWKRRKGKSTRWRSKRRMDKRRKRGINRGRKRS